MKKQNQERHPEEFKLKLKKEHSAKKSILRINTGAPKRISALFFFCQTS